VGIYAVVSQSVQERSQELRIRLTFGAAQRHLFAGEMKRATRLILLSAGAGVVGAAAALRVLAAEWNSFTAPVLLPPAASTVLLVALALVATAIPAYRACRLDLMNR
jgi:hypothetical protein